MIELDYTNYKGKRKTYQIQVFAYITYAVENQYHGNAWIVHAILDNGEERDFALRDIHNPEVLEDLRFMDENFRY